MKKTLLLVIACLLIFSLISCRETENEDDHVHNFNQCIATEDYLATDADCEEPATYFYSCECGETDFDHVFYNGAPAPHNFKDGICTNCGEDDPGLIDGPIELPSIPIG